MKTLFSDEPCYTGHPDQSIFLVGPTPRRAEVPSWRPDAIKTLEKLDYKGLVLVPERRDWTVRFNYLDQINWELAGLTHAEIIVCWVPRCMKDMPALTTNVEMGYWLAKTPERVYYGRPDGTPHVGYLDWLYTKETNREPFASLDDLLTFVVENT